MDLFQLLINLPFIDPRKLTSKVVSSWNWTLDSVAKPADAAGMGNPMDGSMSPDGMPLGGDQSSGMMPPDTAAGGMPFGMPPGMPPSANMPNIQGMTIPSDVLQGAISMLRKPGEMAPTGSPFSQLSSPVNLLRSDGLPPSARGVPGPKPAGKTSNPRGMNRTGKVNTTIPLNKKTSTESNLLNRAFNVQ